MGERTLLSHFFLAEYNAGIIKREARTQLFIIDPIVGLDLFYLIRLPCENYSVDPRR